MKQVPFTFFALVSIIVIIILLSIAYYIKRRDENKSTYTFINFLNDGKHAPDINEVIIGLSFGVVLGLVDSLGIWIGVDQIENYIAGSSKLKATVASIYSNVMGISAGTVANLVLISIIKSNHQSPIYLSVLGAIIGGGLGIMIGTFILH